jgi:hypothetical protein
VPDRELITVTVEIGTIHITPMAVDDVPQSLIEIPGVTRPDFDKLCLLMATYKQLGNIQERLEDFDTVREEIRGQLDLPWMPRETQPPPRQIYRIISRTTVRRRWRQTQVIMVSHNLTPWLYATARFAPQGTIRVLTEADR